MMKKIKEFIIKHKILSLIIFLLVVGLVIFFVVKNEKKEEVRYVLAEVGRGDIVTTVTGTGQVESLNSLEIKPETSGKVNYVGVKEGQEVKKGTLIASIDCKDQKNSLESARLSLEKLITADPLSVLKAENNLDGLYNSSWNDLTSFMNEVNNIFTEMDDFYASDGFLGYSNTSSLKSIGREKIDSSLDLLEQAERKFDDLEEEYQNLSKLSDKQKILELMDKTLEVAKIISTSVKETETTTNYVIERKDEALTDSESSTARDNVSSWLDKINGYVNTLKSNINSFDESAKSLEETKTGGADELDIRSSELSVQSKLDAYNDCFTRAPFDGMITNLTAKVGESSSSYGTLVTKQKIATVSLNEIDIVSVSDGQEANLTFDAISGLTIQGEVNKIYSVGSVNSGVVSYDVEVVFNQDDERVKTGMSVNVEIITNSKKDILTLPSEAINTRNGKSYVEVFETPVDNVTSQDGIVTTSKVIRKEIEVGITDDTLTEIISGLNEGDQIILKTTSEEETSSSSGGSTNSRNEGGMIPGGGVRMGGSAMGSMMR